MDSKKILLSWELYQNNVSVNDIAKHCNKHRSTISKWINRIKKIGLSEYAYTYSQAKGGIRAGRQIGLETIDIIRSIKENNLEISGYQIRERLMTKYGVSISVSKIYEILRKNN